MSSPPASSHHVPPQLGPAWAGPHDFWDESVEFVDDYGPGKLHPVALGDKFAGSRYKIIRKLGAGSFSTVWLVRDLRTSHGSYVALKIATAKSSATKKEVKILQYLANSKLGSQGETHVTPLLDSFEHQGPNGLHRCLVFDVMGPSSSTMIENMPSDRKTVAPGAVIRERGRFPLWMAKSVLRQTLLGLNFLHRNNITHGDVQPGNILFSLKTLETLKETDLAQTDGRDFAFTRSDQPNGDVAFGIVEAKVQNQVQPAERQEGSGTEVDEEVGDNIPENGLVPGSESDSSLPRYIIQKQPMFKHVNLEPPLLVRLSDLGGSFFSNEPPDKLVTPRGLRSPEVILGESVTQAHDIWSFGCLIFEFVTGRMLFPLFPSFPSTEDEEDVRNADNETDDGHVLQMVQLLGPLPQTFLGRFPRSDTYFNEAGEVIKNYVGELPDDMSEEVRSADETTPNLEECLGREKGEDLSESEASTVARLLRTMLQFDPENRPTAVALLEHPWFQE